MSLLSVLYMLIARTEMGTRRVSGDFDITVITLSFRTPYVFGHPLFFTEIINFAYLMFRTYENFGYFPFSLFSDTYIFYQCLFNKQYFSRRPLVDA